jgi:hypothetical protein
MFTPTEAATVCGGNTSLAVTKDKTYKSIQLHDVQFAVRTIV